MMQFWRGVLAVMCGALLIWFWHCGPMPAETPGWLVVQAIIGWVTVWQIMAWSIYTAISEAVK